MLGFSEGMGSSLFSWGVSELLGSHIQNGEGVQLRACGLKGKTGGPWARGFRRHATLWMSYVRVLAASLKTAHQGWGVMSTVVGATKIACHNILQQIHQIGTAGVVHTSLSGVKSYD